MCARAQLTAFEPGTDVERAVAVLDPKILDWPDEQPFFKVSGPEDLLQAAALLDSR